MFGPDEVFESLPPADVAEGAPLDQDLGRPRAEVVVGGHRESVGTRIENSEQVSFRRLRDFHVAREEVARLADRPDDIRPDVLNRILWWDSKGYGRPYPGR